MTSNDGYITIEMFNAGIQEIKTDLSNIQSEIKEIKTEVRITNNRIDNMAERIEDLKFFGTVGLAIIAIFIALVALRREKPETKPERVDELPLSNRNIRDIRALIREELSLLNLVNRGN